MFKRAAAPHMNLGHERLRIHPDTRVLDLDSNSLSKILQCQFKKMLSFILLKLLFFYVSKLKSIMFMKARRCN